MLCSDTPAGVFQEISDSGDGCVYWAEKTSIEQAT
jgi:hypothetical protein